MLFGAYNDFSACEVVVVLDHYDIVLPLFSCLLCHYYLMRPYIPLVSFDINVFKPVDVLERHNDS